MLQLINIRKDYKTSSEVVHALKGVSISFRENEFVSILGPSGCGKTTMLNIIGGLDHYTDGDLVIGDRSTKLYKDRDWDVYRNHRIGFIFQSYNLIPHPTVLGNVELALTIAGISREERIERAKRALDRVGLEGQYYKKPNQLSGGQGQRVAIARALVNDPEILLADEPTGALDTVTSKQIMELIKEISGERLVIMVTHNPDLADEYSTRIVRLLDGEIIEDTNPMTAEEVECEMLAIKAKEEAEEAALAALPIEEEKKARREKKRRTEKAKMSFFTAFRLSAKNLLSKGARTAMVGFAGSIGIIGIAMVLAFSAGIKGYIASMQDDMLSGNPIRIQETSIDFTALSGMMDRMDDKDFEKEPHKAYISSIVTYFATMKSDVTSMILKNTITKEYIDYVKAMDKSFYQAMVLGYGIDIEKNLYTSFGDSESSVSHIQNYYTAVLEKTDFGSSASLITAIVPTFTEAPSSTDYIESQYDVYGKIATEANEIMLVLDSDQMLTDILLAKLGYYTEDQFLNIVYKAVEDDNTENPLYNPDLDVDSFTFKELLNDDKIKFTWYSNNDVYSITESTNPFNGSITKNVTYNPNSAGFVGEDKLDLKVVGILQPKPTISYGCMTSGVYYTQALTDYVLENSMDTEIATHLNETAGNAASASYSFDFKFMGETFTKDMSGLLGGIRLTSRTVGGNDLANSVKIYPISFEEKDLVTDYLNKWNSDEVLTVNGVELTPDDRADVSYTDALEIVIGMLNTLIDIVSYALIAFTSISLVVSTVMIGIITYVSVVERIKEIGVIRSLGGRKKDVSYLFNAETFIIGSLSGIIGIVATYVISIIANAILTPLIAYPNIAALPISDAIVLILLSIGLTLISGLIPASSAAKKDPVVALRTE